jgi:hypothetical protein
MPRAIRVLLLALLTGLAGCGGPSSLSGLVTLDGEPLSDAGIAFFPEQDEAEMVVGTTDQEGRYLITPAAGESIAYGKYKVVVSKRAQPTPAEVEAFITPEELIPAKYSDKSQTELIVEVKSGAEIDLHLKR